jgi:5-(carboxyamino)imidazole ribonucleotide synthase
LAVAGVSLHLYGKSAAKPGRKMGHLTATATDAATAKQRVDQARQAVQPRPHAGPG